MSDLAMLEIPPRSDWSVMSESEHFVQFYETDVFLLNSLGGFISTGLNAGDACIVVATKARREALEVQLQSYGFDMATASECGQYTALDAEETLAKFMADGSPDPWHFAKVIGGIIARAAVDRHRVRIFGEMVALLWAEEKYDAAIRLEELWNDLHKIHPFLLFCAYPMSGLGKEALAEPLNRVCAGHSHVIPAESYTTCLNPDDQLRAIILLQQKASLLEAEIAERKQTEVALREVKTELELQLEERKQLLIREQSARAEAEAANRMKDEFLATVSHELRTPLNSIIGWAHLLRKCRMDEATVTRAVETIERNSKSQAQLIEDILDVSRVITGKLRLNIGLVDVASVINAAIDCVQLAADSKGIEIEVTLDASVPYIAGDSIRLQQVVWNLLSNAIKFTPAGGRIKVRMQRAGSDVQIGVSDTGQGISSDFIPFIFDRFRQADASTSRMHTGLGLGLAIVRHLIELHGGTVCAESLGEGCGATFTIKLPLAIATERSRDRTNDAESKWPGEDSNARVKPLPSLDGVQVLLVDDNLDSLQLLTAMLTEYRAKVITAKSAAEALEALHCYKPDVLVSDLAMPGQDGYSLISKIRALKAESGGQIPAVALTAYVRVEDRARALSAGFNMFVPKPVEMNELIAIIANLTEHRTTEIWQA